MLSSNYSIMMTYNKKDFITLKIQLQIVVMPWLE